MLRLSTQEPVRVCDGSHVRSSGLSSTDTCGDLLVTLQSLSRQGEKRSLQLSGKVNSMTFTFDKVLPGKYKSKMGLDTVASYPEPATLRAYCRPFLGSSVPEPWPAKLDPFVTKVPLCICSGRVP